MSKPLPPLNALRAFEASGRHLSLTLAAEELHVTPAAISHQVKGLEANLGMALFIRRNRQLILTDAGQLLLSGLTESFARLRRAVDSVLSIDQARPLNVSVTPSFASKWLIRRLAEFRQRHPEIDVRLQASIELADFEIDDVDLAIRYGAGDYEGLHVVPLPCGDTTPVCSPSLLKGDHPLIKPDDLRHHTLLHIEYAHFETLNDWEMWLSVAKQSDIDATAGPHFPDDNMALGAAIEGQGVALVSTLLAADDLRAGRLVQPFALPMASEYCYYLLCRNNWTEDAKVVAFHDWFVAIIEDEFSPDPR